LELMKISDAGQATEEVRSMMERQTQHMVRLIDDLLDVSRITRGKLELRRSQVKLADVVRNAVDATRPLVEEAGHQLRVELPAPPVLLYADPHRLTQVLSNLLNNAAKYTPPNGKIALVAEQREGEVAVTVSDNGPGIPSDMLEAVFEMFSQVRRAESGHQGLGIGLTLVKRLVEMHGGTVTVECEGPNLGSRFCVRLPAVPAMSDSDSLPGLGASTGRAALRHRVLIVDDNLDALRTLSILVGMLGHEVCEARDGVEAIEATERFEPDVVLMDIGMPRLNGYEAARRIRQEPWGLDVLLVATTGWGQEEDRRRTREAGFDHHLVKPVELSQLQAVLEGLVPRRLPEVEAACHRPPKNGIRSHADAAPAGGVSGKSVVAG
jgi:CheY-like chemotaxis protein